MKQIVRSVSGRGAPVPGRLQPLQVSDGGQTGREQRLREHEVGGGGNLRPQQAAPPLKPYLDRVLNPVYLTSAAPSLARPE